MLSLYSGMVGVAFWAEYELDQNIIQSFSAARNATDIMENLRNTVGHLDYCTHDVGLSSCSVCSV